jgi:hypothetical protein
MLSFNIIASFNKHEQDIFDLDVNSKNIKESTFISAILKNIDNVEDLYKISVCQMNCKTHEELLPFLVLRNGKYYFNYDINKDDDTLFWQNFRDEYVIKNK